MFQNVTQRGLRYRLAENWHPLESCPHDSLQKVKGWVVRLILGKNTEGIVLMGGYKTRQASRKFHHIMRLLFNDTLNFHLGQDNNCKNI